MNFFVFSFGPTAGALYLFWLLNFLGNALIEHKVRQRFLKALRGGALRFKRWRPLVRGLLSLMLSTTFISPALAWDSPQRAIDEFLIFDLNGGRITEWDWKTYITKYIAAPRNYEEPAWDELTIIKAWQVKNLTCASKNRCSVEVKYFLLPTGKLNDPNVVPHEFGGVETQIYHIVRRGKEWLVAPDVGAPRILEAIYWKFKNK